MDKASIDVWKKANDEIESILRKLGDEYVKINSLDHLNISYDIEVSDLHLNVIDTFRSECSHVGGFSVSESDLICPAGLINKWRMKASRREKNEE